MQVEILPDVQPGISTIELCERRVTYQIAMIGTDGAVLASDQSERMVNYENKVATQNLVKKIRLNDNGQFAWCFAGGKIARLTADHFARAINQSECISAQNAALRLGNCTIPAIDEWRESAAGPSMDPYNVVTLLCGKEKKIFRNSSSRSGQVEEMQGGWCVAGSEFNVASFLPRRFYSLEMSVKELACLAAYSIHAAHDFDSAFVNGLDIAVYRDSIGRFEMVDSQFYWNQINEFDASFRKAIEDCAPAIADHLQ